ncbi:DUF4386 domain-containing protein [Hymenobacter jejuensis]|uniref:DUF4386 domain-containing protein n=1 Tax=Hymenobacter jejuensis TaxID=2502781 RepID=A0A5B8A253_9BACT|nr:DUF4386 domain-containing protein [Hymenobacter jejuensis]QDA61474.1 DUF4386 domain-containing protein [Hymenobacter jejuensis]
MDSGIYTGKTSPQVYARIGGALYLVIIATGIFGELFVRGKLVVSGDATATAHNIMASQLLWRSGIAVDLITHICDVPLMLIFYVLLRPVNKHLALLALLFTSIQTAVLVAFDLSLLVALFLLGSADYLKAFQPQQLHALAYVFIKSYSNGFGIGLIFFGFACLVLGYLIFRSGYLPRFIGVLMQIAGLCYLTNSFALLLAPAVANLLFPAILLPSFIGELAFCLWLLVKGVNLPKWETHVSPEHG